MAEHHNHFRKIKYIAGIISVILLMLIFCIAVPVQAAQIPNDPLFKENAANTNQPAMWHLLSENGGISAVDAWNIPQKENIIVAVIDTGIYTNHPDLEKQLWINTDEEPSNGIDDDGNGYVDDYYGWNFALNNEAVADLSGHGTNCAGLVGAVRNNNEGMAGVSQKVTIMPLVISNPSGKTSTKETAEAIRYAVDNGAKIISDSNQGNPILDKNDATYQQYLEMYKPTLEAIKYADEKGVLFINAAGNGFCNIDENWSFPAEFNRKDVNGTNIYGVNNMIVAGSTSYGGNYSWFTNYGTSVVDLGVPGDMIVTTTVSLKGTVQAGINAAEDEKEKLAYLGKGIWTKAETDKTSNVNGFDDALVISGKGMSIIGTAEPVRIQPGNTNEFNLFSAYYDSENNGKCAFYLSSKPVSAYNSVNEFGKYIHNPSAAAYQNAKPEKHIIRLDISSILSKVSIDDNTLRKEFPRGEYYLAAVYEGPNKDAAVKLYTYDVVNDISVNKDAPLYSIDGVSGTSFSAPVAAGAAAYILSVNPDLSPAEVKDCLLSTVDMYDSLKDKFYTGGILNLNKAVRKIAKTNSNTAASPLSYIGVLAGLSAAVIFLRRRS